MEARKIILFGNSSHVISVPKSWIKENKLKKGDLIFVERNSDGELILLPKEGKEEKERKIITINAEKKEKAFLIREIVSAYLAAPSLIVIEGNNLRKNDSIIKFILNGLSGLEIITQTSNQIKIKDVLDINRISLKEMLRRMDNLIRLMIFEIENKKGTSSKLFKRLQEIDKEVNKLFFLILKIIKMGFYESKIFKQHNISIAEAFQILSIISSLEHMADELKGLPDYLNQINAKEKKQVASNLNYLEGLYLNTFKAYYKNDKKTILAVYKKGREFYKNMDKIKGSKNFILIHQNFKKIENTLYQINKTLLDSIFFEK